MALRAWAVLPEDDDMSRHMPRHRIDTSAGYRVTFAKEVMGVRFPIAAVEVRRARDPDRARRAAELRFSRRFGQDWRMRANVEEVEAAALHGWLRHSLSGRDPQEGDDEDADN